MKRLCSPLLVVFLLLAFLHGVAGAASHPQPRVHQFKLANGLTVIVKPDRRAPTVVHMVWYRVGSIDEVDGTSGVAHVVEHMMFKGTRKLKPGEFSQRVAALGGRENAFTTKEATGYHQQVHQSRLAQVMALEADRMAHLVVLDHEFRKEIEVVKEERRSRTEDNPHGQLWEQLSAVAFTTSPVRRPIVGWMNDIEAMTAQDVRDFYARWYAPNNAVLIVVGDVDPGTVKALAERSYGRLRPKILPERKPRIEPPQQGLRRLVVKAPAEQAYVALTFKTPKLQNIAGPDEAYALEVLAAVLDGYSGARLERALVKSADRVADSAGAGYGLIGRGPQTFVLDGVPAPGKTVAEVEQALREQVARIAQEGVTEAELQRVKAQLVAGQVYKLDSISGQAWELGNAWINGLSPAEWDRLIDGLRAVTAEQVKAVAAKYFGDDQLTVAVLEPQPVDPNRPKRQAAPGARH